MLINSDPIINDCWYYLLIKARRDLSAACILTLDWVKIY